MLNLINLSAAFGLAKMQEEYLVSSNRGSKTLGEKSTNQPRNSSNPWGNKNFVRNPRVTSIQWRREEKRDLCYNCEEKWNLEHVSKSPKVYVLQAVEDLENVSGGEGSEELKLIEEEETSVGSKVELEISLNAITGTPSSNTMRIVGKVAEERVMVLVDSGSTHNFLDPSVLQQCRGTMDRSKKITIKVVNGEIITSEGFVQLELKMQGIKFFLTFYVLSLGGL